MSWKPNDYSNAMIVNTNGPNLMALGDQVTAPHAKAPTYTEVPTIVEMHEDKEDVGEVNV